MIVKKDKKYFLYSKKKVNGKHKKLGVFDSRKKAEKREKQINFFKYKSKI
jgi:hypothetical protein